MSSRRTFGDELLFMLALAACLVGLALLLKTTGVAQGFKLLWPLIVIAVGGVLLFISTARGKGGIAVFATGIFFSLFGCCTLIAVLLGYHLRNLWPLIMVSAGAAWLAAGFRQSRHLRVGYCTPALGFMLLGVIFCFFSFDIAPMGFGKFIRAWWPSVLVAGGIILFAAYGLARAGRRRPPE
jgi:hypothetical protein